MGTIGLESYVVATRSERLEVLDPCLLNANEIHYWRNHFALHGWMEHLYREKGGKGSSSHFAVNLDSGDIRQLENDVVTGEIHDFDLAGVTRGAPCDQRVGEFGFIVEARKLIEAGFAVYYQAWW